jgi:hypothetical protein
MFFSIYAPRGVVHAQTLHGRIHAPG